MQIKKKLLVLFFKGDSKLLNYSSHYIIGQGNNTSWAGYICTGD